jgi:4-aminobutyrate aminotransferase
MFTCEHYDVVPDMLVIGKGLGGGIFPLAGLLAREGLNQAMPEKALGHYTHEKNPVACAAGLAAIEVIESEGLLEQATAMGVYARKRMEAMATRHDLIGDIRGLGLLMGMELLKDRASCQRAVDEAEQVMYACLSRGLNFKVTMGNILTLTPPITITRQEMEEAMDRLEEAIAEVSGGVQSGR